MSPAPLLLLSIVASHLPDVKSGFRLYVGTCTAVVASATGIEVRLNPAYNHHSSTFISLLKNYYPLFVGSLLDINFNSFINLFSNFKMPGATGHILFYKSKLISYTSNTPFYIGYTPSSTSITPFSSGNIPSYTSITPFSTSNIPSYTSITPFSTGHIPSYTSITPFRQAIPLLTQALPLFQQATSLLK